MNNGEVSASSTLKNPEEVKSDKSTLTDSDKQEIAAQAVREISFNRKYKQGKIRNWQRNEELYYIRKQVIEQARSSVELGKMQGYVEQLLSEIDDPLLFKFHKRKEAQLKRVARLNAVRHWDSNIDFWDMKDVAMKKQCIIYGRAAAVYYADSIDGIYEAHLEPIDIYDLLVDPDGGGLDVEQMLNWGRYGVVKSKESLKLMVETETDSWIKSNLNSLIDGSGNNTEMTQEETNKRVRMYAQNTIGPKQLQTDEKYKFWQWFTTYKNVRYVLTIQEHGGSVIDISPLKDKFDSNLWPLWTYSAVVDLTEFWTPSKCDLVREIFMNQNVTINQMNDNAEAINKPMKVVNVKAIENLAELKYRRDGIIKTRGDFDANKAIQILTTPSIDTPLKVYDTLEAIADKSSGVTETEKGTEDADGSVEIYKGNRKASDGRFGLFNKSYSFGYNRFANLYQHGVREHLIKKTAIDIIGPNGIETESFSRNDIFRKNDNFRVEVESSNADKLKDSDRTDKKIEVLKEQEELQANGAKAVMNTQKSFETKARLAGFSDDEIRELLDVDEYGDADLMSQCAEDIESIMDGKIIEPNAAANNAYKQKIVDWMIEHKQDMTKKQFSDIVKYTNSLQQIIYKNMARQLNQEKTNMITQKTNAVLAAPPEPVGQPGAPPITAPAPLASAGQ